MKNNRELSDEYKKELLKKTNDQADLDIRKKDQKKSALYEMISAFGIIGWSVVTPIVAGVFAGKYIDEHWPSKYSWTLMLIFAGTVFGSYNAWSWLKKKMGGKNGNKP